MNITQLRRQLTDYRNEMAGIIDAAKDNRRNLTPTEVQRFDVLETEITDLKGRIDAVTVEESRQAIAANARNNLGLGDGTGTGLGHQVSEHTYRKGGEHRYFQDLAAAALPGVNPAAYAAADRLTRHAHEMEIDARSAAPDSLLRRSWDSAQRAAGDTQSRVGLTTAVGSGGTFLPPSYLLDQFIQFPRQGRVLADLVRKQDLPKGPMAISIPKIQTGTLVASQATQNTTVVEQDLTDAYVTAPVVTWAGEQTVSLQAIEQSAIPFDEIVLGDLEMDRDRMIEQDVVNGSGAVGHATGVLTTSGITTVTYTSANPVAMGAWPYIGQCKARVFDAIFRPADIILMTPDRWAWFEIARDTQNRPLVLPMESGPMNAAGIVNGQLVNGPVLVGKMFGLPVYVTTALPTNLGAGTNQDEIVVLSSRDLLLWESAPVARALPQTTGATLSVLLQTYSYGAFMPNRLPGAIANVSGSGLTTPVYA